MYANTLQAQIYGADWGFMAYCDSFNIANSGIGGVRPKYMMRAANLRWYARSVSGNYTWYHTIAFPKKGMRCLCTGSKKRGNMGAYPTQLKSRSPR